MPDITMCKGEGCPLKKNCYRFTAKPFEFRQSYFITSPIKDSECEYYWFNEKYEKENAIRNKRTLRKVQGK